MRYFLQLSLFLLCGAGLFGVEVKETSLREIKKTSKDLEEVREIFREIKKISSQNKKDCSHGAFHIKKNRHKSFLPFNENRTCREIPDFYISASDVVTKNGAYIMAQAPIKSTVTDFFRALVERKSPLIVTLVMPKEKGADKCFPFWKYKHFPMKINGWTIERLDQQKVIAQASSNSDHRIVQRLFKCSNSETGDIHHITQLHYQNWPDNGVPEFDLFLGLIKQVEEMNISSYAPITVHCSAGIGRTGTFVAAHNLRKQISLAKDPKNFKLNIPKEILRLRRQRHSLIATAKQLQVVYMAVAEKGKQ